MSNNRIRFTFRDNSEDAIRALEAAVQNALTKAGLFIEGEAKLRAPVDTGLLRGSITHQIINDNEVQIGSDLHYALPVEKGHSRHAPQPYLTPAAEDNINDIKEILESELRRI